MQREAIFEAIENERARQDSKFPGQWSAFGADFATPVSSNAIFAAHSRKRRAAFECAAILAEEAGEVARAVIDRDDAGLEHELVQVAAVCVAWLEARP